MSNYRDNTNPSPNAGNGDIAQRYEGAPTIQGTPPSYTPGSARANAANLVIQELSKGYRLHEFNELKQDLVKSHGAVTGALSDIDTKKTPEGGVLVRAYGLADPSGRIHDHQGIDIVKGSSLQNALDNVPARAGEKIGGYQYLWIGKNSSPANAPDNISIINSREYLQYVFPQLKLRSDNGTDVPTNSVALVEGNKNINDQYRSLNEKAIALGVSNPSDQAAVALKTLYDAKGYNPESGDDLKLLRSNHGGLIVSQGEGPTSINLQVPQAKQGDFQKVSTELASIADTQRTITQKDSQEISENKSHSTPVRA
jgi:hypothetical protein